MFLVKKNMSARLFLIAHSNLYGFKYRFQKHFIKTIQNKNNIR